MRPYSNLIFIVTRLFFTTLQFPDMGASRNEMCILLVDTANVIVYIYLS